MVLAHSLKNIGRNTLWVNPYLRAHIAFYYCRWLAKKRAQERQSELIPAPNWKHDKSKCYPWCASDVTSTHVCQGKKSQPSPPHNKQGNWKHWLCGCVRRVPLKKVLWLQHWNFLKNMKDFSQQDQRRAQCAWYVWCPAQCIFSRLFSVAAHWQLFHFSDRMFCTVIMYRILVVFAMKCSLHNSASKLLF